MTIVSVQYGGKEDVTDSVGLLISILVRYPEVSTIYYDPTDHVLRFNFVSSGIVQEKQLQSIQQTLLDSIEALNFLEHKKTRLVEIHCQTCYDLTMIEVRRDVDTLVQEEISLLVTLMQQMDYNIVTEGNDGLFEEDLLMQEEIIEHMLESVKDTAGDKNLFAFREEGRVLVFNQ